MIHFLKITTEIENLINICKSSSKMSGTKLRNAHSKFGELLGNLIEKNEDICSKKVAVVIMMRAGLPLGMGIADSMEKSNKIDVIFSSQTNINFENYDTVIIADAVVNTGNSLLRYIEEHRISNPIIATTVIPEKNIDNFKKLNIYTARISKNSYTGTKDKEIQNGKGPDTGDRLFSSYFFS